jgi:hypothetical protein
MTILSDWKQNPDHNFQLSDYFMQANVNGKFYIEIWNLLERGYRLTSHQTKMPDTEKEEKIQ